MILTENECMYLNYVFGYEFVKKVREEENKEVGYIEIKNDNQYYEIFKNYYAKYIEAYNLILTLLEDSYFKDLRKVRHKVILKRLRGVYKDKYKEIIDIIYLASIEQIIDDIIKNYKSLIKNNTELKKINTNQNFNFFIPCGIRLEDDNIIFKRKYLKDIKIKYNGESEKINRVKFEINPNKIKLILYCTEYFIKTMFMTNEEIFDSFEWYHKEKFKDIQKMENSLNKQDAKIFYDIMLKILKRFINLEGKKLRSDLLFDGKLFFLEEFEFLKKYTKVYELLKEIYYYCNILCILCKYEYLLEYERVNENNILC